jgi:hypothetical protein
MKKSMVMIFSLILMISMMGMALAQQDKDSNKLGIEVEAGINAEVYGDKGAEFNAEIKAQGNITQEQARNIIQTKNQLRIQAQNQSECPSNCSCSGSTTKCEFSDENGIRREMTIRAGNSGNIIIQVKDANASTNVTLYRSEGKVYGIFKDNETKEIILPDEAKERIQNKTRARLHNETFELTEEGNYEVQARKESRLLWTIPVKERVRAEIDAETGEVTRIRSSWWGFLAKDSEDNSEGQ